MGPMAEEVVQDLLKAWMTMKVASADYWRLDLYYTYNTEVALFVYKNKMELWGKWPPISRKGNAGVLNVFRKKQ
jgi:hypothetical protein